MEVEFPSSKQTTTSYLTPWVIRSLRLYHGSLGLLPPFVANVELEKYRSKEQYPGNVQVQFQKFSWRTIPSIMVAIIIVWVDVMSILVLAKKFYFPINTSMNIIQIAASMMLANGSSALILMAYEFLTTGKEFASVLSYLMSNAAKFRFCPVPKKQTDIGGLLLFYYVSGIIVFGLPMPLVIWFFCGDPIRVIMNEFFLDDPLYQPMRTIVITNVFTLVVFQLVVFTLTRGLGVVLIILITFLSCLEAHLHTLIQITNVFNKQQIHQHYLQIMIIYKSGYQTLGQIAIVLVVFSQILLVQLPWFSINCFKYIPVFLILTFTAAFFGALGLTIFLFQVAAYTRERSLQLIKRNMRIFHLRDKKEVRYWFLTWKALQPLSIPCGENFVFIRDSIMIYLDLLSSNITNAILLVTL